MSHSSSKKTKTKNTTRLLHRERLDSVLSNQAVAAELDQRRLKIEMTCYIRIWRLNHSKMTVAEGARSIKRRLAVGVVVGRRRVVAAPRRRRRRRARARRPALPPLPAAAAAAAAERRARALGRGDRLVATVLEQRVVELAPRKERRRVVAVTMIRREEARRFDAPRHTRCRARGGGRARGLLVRFARCCKQRGV